MKRILLIDDDGEVRSCLRTILEQAGYHVLEAENGKAGIEFFMRFSAELVMVDIFMPEKEGIETIRELRREFPELKIMAMSGGIPGCDPDQYLGIAKKLGADRSIEKPFRRDQILAAVGELLAPMRAS